MTLIEARRIGIKYSLLSAVYIFIVYELLFLISETRGDFANGILFFFEKQANLFSIIIYLTLFLSFGLLGMDAGKRLLIKKAGVFPLSIIYTLITTALTFIIPFIELSKVWSMNGIYDIDGRRELIRNFFVFLTIAFIVIIIGWLLSTYRIRRKRMLLEG